jgi:hypothetical protein
MYGQTKSILGCIFSCGVSRQERHAVVSDFPQLPETIESYYTTLAGRGLRCAQPACIPCSHLTSNLPLTRQILWAKDLIRSHSDAADLTVGRLGVTHATPCLL